MDKLILELIEVKYEKSICAKNQEYEKAAHLRDTEKKLEKKIYHIITKSETDKHYMPRTYNETIDNYIIETYGVNYPNIWINLDDTKAFIRELKLKIMGI
jgi:hypothetical protein